MEYATNDLALYFNSETGKSTGSAVSVIKVNAVPALCKNPGGRIFCRAVAQHRVCRHSPIFSRARVWNLKYD